MSDHPTIQCPRCSASIPVPDLSSVRDGGVVFCPGCGAKGTFKGPGPGDVVDALRRALRGEHDPE